MADALDYIVAATVSAVRSQSSAGGLPQEPSGLKTLVEKRFGIELSESVFAKLLERLRSENLIVLVDDDYAGQTMSLQKARMESAAKSNVLDKVDLVGSSLLKKAFSNPKFWFDLESLDLDDGSDISIEINQHNIPASDRVVSLNHNQFNLLDKPIESIIDLLDRDNGLADQPGVKELMLGQIRAGREFIRAGVFNLSIFRMTMISGLQMIVERYKEHAIGAAASALLTLILHELGLTGF